MVISREERNKMQNERYAKTRANMSPEEIEEFRLKHRISASNFRANMSPEKKEKLRVVNNTKRREKLANMSKEEKAEVNKKRIAKMTPEQRKEKNRRQREKTANRSDNEIQNWKTYYKEIYANLSPEEKADLARKSRERSIKRYGLTIKEYNEKLESQDNRCAICKNKFINTRDMHIDHDHITGLVRGLLCSKCNVGIGHFNDDPYTLERAIEYLKNHAKNNPRESTLKELDIYKTTGEEK